MGLHVQALLGNGCQGLHAIDGHHVSQNVLVEGEADNILSTPRHTVALQMQPSADVWHIGMMFGTQIAGADGRPATHLRQK